MCPYLLSLPHIQNHHPASPLFATHPRPPGGGCSCGKPAVPQEAPAAASWHQSDPFRSRVFPVFQAVPTFRIRRTFPPARSLPPRQTRFVLLELKFEPANRDETSHLDCPIPEHRAARLALHQRPAAPQPGFVTHPTAPP